MTAGVDDGAIDRGDDVRVVVAGPAQRLRLVLRAGPREAVDEHDRQRRFVIRPNRRRHPERGHRGRHQHRRDHRCRRPYATVDDAPSSSPYHHPLRRALARRSSPAASAPPKRTTVAARAIWSARRIVHGGLPCELSVRSSRPRSSWPRPSSSRPRAVRSPPIGGTAAPVITVVSSDPARVSGGDALVEVRLPSPGTTKHLRIIAGAVDVTAAFTEVAPGVLRGLVTGLRNGETRLVVRLNGNGRGEPPGRSAAVVVTNHPLAGPVFSGAHQTPFYCETVAAGLGPSTDDDCSAPTQVVYRYRRTNGSFATLADPASRPAGPRVRHGRRRQRAVHRPPRARRDRPWDLRDRRPPRRRRARRRCGPRRAGTRRW